MEQGRPQRRFVVLAVCVLVVALLIVAWLRRDPYASAKGVRGVPEFIGQPLSFAVSRLGEPARTFEFTVAEAGRTVLIEVVGRTDGSLWGTDIYTADSRLATAAVHAGAVREGERGLVRVTIVDSAEETFAGSQRNGVQSFDYANYPVGYRVERV